MRAQEVLLVTFPVTGAPAVHAGRPVAQFFAVALAAQAVRLVERHLLAACQMEGIPICRIVAVEAPAVLFVVGQDDVSVHIRQLTPGAVNGQVGMARRTRKDAVRERRRGNFEPLGGLTGRRRLGSARRLR